MADAPRMRLLGPKLFATRYTRPPKVGSLWLNDAYLTDTSRSLWEVKESPLCDGACRTKPRERRCANCFLGIILDPEWLLVTAPNSGVFFSYDAKMREVFILAASSVRRVIPWTRDASEVILAEGQVLVRTRRRDDERRGALFVVRSDEPSGSASGEVVATAHDVEGVAPGDVVVFSIHAGVETEVGGERLLVVDEKSVMAVV